MSALSLPAAPPLRPSLVNGYRPAWRWIRANQLARHALLNRSVYTKDAYLGRVVTFARGRLAADGCPAKLERLRRQDPLINDAHAVYEAASYDRWLIEALVVANLPRDEICRHYPATVELIELYEAAFFDVRDLLRYPGFVPT